MCACLLVYFCACTPVYISHSPLAPPPILPRPRFLLSPFQNSRAHIFTFNVHSRKPTQYATRSTLHFLPSHPLHPPHPRHRSTARRLIFPLRLSWQDSPPRPHRRSIPPSNRSRCRLLHLPPRLTRITQHNSPILQFSLSFLSSFFFHPSSFPRHPPRPPFLQHHHHHPHRRRGAFQPRPQT